MKINWKVRFKNPYFWFGLLAVILTAIGADPEMFTSWEIVFDKIKIFINNPFLISCTIVAIIGYINDQTTAGLNDSAQALTYNTPKKQK